MLTEYPYIPEPRSQAEMEALSQDDLQRLIAQRNEASARATLVESLILMGRLEEALIIELREDEKAWIRKLIAAEKQEDDHRCNCTSHVDAQDYVRKPEGEPVLVETPHYIRTYRHFSLRYERMAWFYRCQECECVQTLPDDQIIDEISAKRYAAQQQAVDEALKRGTPVIER